MSAPALPLLRSKTGQVLAKLLEFAARPVVLDVLLLAATVWIAHFYHFRSLGLYEDDYTHTSPALGWSATDMLVWIADAFRYWDLGRPLGFALGGLLSFLGAQLGGLPGMYVLAFVVHAANASLFYLLLTRMGQRGVGLIGGVLFALFPADTTHPFLMHSFGLHISLTFLLLASHAYLSGRKFVAYLLALCCLLIYETPYAVFLGIPVLCLPWDRRLPKELLSHAVIWLGIMLVVLGIRIGISEGRITDVGSGAGGLTTVLKHTLAALVIGPSVSLQQFWQGPRWVISYWTSQLLPVFVAGLAIFALMLFRVRASAASGGSEATISDLPDGPRGASHDRPAVGNPGIVKLMIAGAVLTILGYGFSFTHYPPTAIAGRLTSVHLAAAFGGALLIASLLWGLLTRIRPGPGLLLGSLLVAGYGGLILAYSFSIQQDYVSSWHNQQRLWSAVVAEVPDVKEGTIILLENHGVPQNHFILTTSWSTPLTLEQVFRFPAEWSDPPRLFVVSPKWVKSLEWDGGELTWKVPSATWSSYRGVLPAGNTVLLIGRGRTLTRQTGTLKVARRTFELKPPGPAQGTYWPRGPLYPLLIAGAD